LHRQFERFFSGALPIPPEDLRTRVQNDFRQLRNAPLRSAADQFRMSGLEYRHNTLSELWNRRLREREEGRHALPHVAHPAPNEPQLDARLGVVVGEDLSPRVVEALYQGLYQTGAPATVDLESFRSFLGRQLESIRGKTGCESVQFRVANEEGKLKLKAKPLGGAS
jgi:hypothetical protein